MRTAIETNIPIKDREDWLTELYKDAFPLVARHIAKMGGSLEEARDVFQDALVIYYEKQMQGKLVLRYSEKTYVFGISRHLWNKRYHETVGIDQIDILNLDVEDYASVISTADKQICTSSLFKLLQSSGKKCMELLSAFYYEKMPMDKLAEQFGFSGSRSATAQKFKCLEKVKQTVKEKSIYYEDILE
jgi:DNA-directed RNA polymerase specialized sigma24 family protein